MQSLGKWLIFYQWNLLTNVLLVIVTIIVIAGRSFTVNTIEMMIIIKLLWWCDVTRWWRIFLRSSPSGGGGGYSSCSEWIASKNYGDEFFTSIWHEPPLRDTERYLFNDTLNTSSSCQRQRNMHQIVDSL
jgi:hypothetical protein